MASKRYEKHCKPSFKKNNLVFTKPVSVCKQMSPRLQAQALTFLVSLGFVLSSSEAARLQ